MGIHKRKLRLRGVWYDFKRIEAMVEEAGVRVPDA